MIERAQVQTGMVVRDAAGTRLGRVSSFDCGTIRVEKRSVFGDREYVLRYTDVDRISNGELHLSVSREDLRARLGTEPESGQAPQNLIGIEREVTRVDPRGSRTRYEEHVVGVSAQGGDVEERSAARALPNRHHHEEPSVPATAPDGAPGDEDPLILIDDELADEREEAEGAPDLGSAFAEHP